MITQALLFTHTLIQGGAEAANAAAAGDKPDVVQQASEWVQTAKDLAVAHGPNLIGAILILILGRWVVRIITGIVRKIMKKRNVDATLIGFLSSMTSMLLTAFVVMAALERLGVDTTSFAAVIAAAGLAIGFALQGSLGNFAAGVMIIFFKPFKVGDFIEGGGVSGSVTEITIFHTIMKTPDNKKIIVPNGSITGGNVTNYSANPTRRVDLVAGISYGDDVKKAKQVLQRIVESDKRVLADPVPVIAVSQLADSSVNILVRPWVNTADYWSVLWDLTEAIKVEFDKAGISIPFPQRDVHLHEVKASQAA